jgi:hypothetical protein
MHNNPPRIGLPVVGVCPLTALPAARSSFLAEMLVVEVISPTMTRPTNPQLYNVPLPTF